MKGTASDMQQVKERWLLATPFSLRVAVDHAPAPAGGDIVELIPAQDPLLSDPLIRQYAVFAFDRLIDTPQEDSLWDVYGRGFDLARRLANSSFRPSRLSVDATGEREMLFSVFGHNGRGADLFVDAESEDLLFIPIESGTVGEEERIPFAEWSRISRWLDGTSQDH
jgi:hypothetical protein